MPVLCTKCGNVISASQAMDTMDSDMLLAFKNRIDSEYGGIYDLALLEKDSWYVDKAAEDVNRRGMPCKQCGTQGAWKGVVGPGL